MLFYLILNKRLSLFYGIKNGEIMILQTKRLILRPWEKSDAQSLYENAKNPNVALMTGFPPHKSVEESLYIIENILTGSECYAICKKEDNIAIGSIELKMKSKMFENDKKDECEIGFWIGEKYWGNRFVPEAGERLIKRAFEDLGMNVIWANYFTGNEKSKRVQEKLGFVYYKTFENENIKLLVENSIDIKK